MKGKLTNLVLIIEWFIPVAALIGTSLTIGLGLTNPFVMIGTTYTIIMTIIYMIALYIKKKEDDDYLVWHKEIIAK